MHTRGLSRNDTRTADGRPSARRISASGWKQWNRYYASKQTVGRTCHKINRIPVQWPVAIVYMYIHIRVFSTFSYIYYAAIRSGTSLFVSCERSRKIVFISHSHHIAFSVIKPFCYFHFAHHEPLKNIILCGTLSAGPKKLDAARCEHKSVGEPRSSKWLMNTYNDTTDLTMYILSTYLSVSVHYYIIILGYARVLKKTKRNRKTTAHRTTRSHVGRKDGGKKNSLS